MLCWEGGEGQLRGGVVEVVVVEEVEVEEVEVVPQSCPRLPSLSPSARTSTRNPRLSSHHTTFTRNHSSVAPAVIYIYIYI